MVKIDLRSQMAFTVFIYAKKGTTPMSRMRMSKELAQELKDRMGDGAYFYCVEKLSNNTDHPQLWRDVLARLDETNDPVDAGSLTKE